MAESTPAPAAPAATSEPAAAPVTDSGGDQVFETLSDDDRIIEELRAEHTAKELKPEASGKPAAKPEKGKPGKTPAKATEPASAAPAAAKYKSPEEAVSAVVAALEKGDVKALARAVGKPESFLDVTNAKWAAFREQQNGLRERDRTITAREHAYNENVAGIRKEYGPAVAAAKAYREGKMGEFVTLVKELTGEDYDIAQKKVIEGEIAVPDHVKQLREELKAFKEQKAREEQEAKKASEQQELQAQKEQAFARAVDAVTEELASHRVAKLPNFQRQVLTRVRDSWDPESEAYTMSFEEAADAIMADKDAEAEALGYTRHAPAAPPRRAAPPAPGLPPRRADARPADGERWMTEDLSDDEILESIKADVRAGRLKSS